MKAKPMIAELLAITPESWEGLLSGQVGFILATIFYMLLYTKVVLPREDRRTAALERLADSVKMLVVDALREKHEQAAEIVDKIEKMSGK